MTTAVDRAARAAAQRTSKDFVPLEQRTRGLTLRSYTRHPDGSIDNDSGVITLDAEDVRTIDLHPSATWPACRCPQHGGHPAPGALP